MTDLEPGGPYSPDRTAEVAAMMAEAVRYLNHATQGRAGREALHYPSHLDRVVASLATMAQRMPQLLEQMESWLRNETGASRTEVTYGQYAGRADLAYDVTASRMEVAAARFADAAKALEQAHQITSALSGVAGDEGEQD
jgi:hypothetical protein